MENSVVSFAAVGLAIDAEAAGEAAAACEGAQALVSGLFRHSSATCQTQIP